MSLPWPRLLLVIALAAGLAACSKKPAEASKGARGPAPVSAAVVTTKPVPVELVTFGTVEPGASVSVKAEVGGVLTKVHFNKGDAVKKGDLLFTIDPRPFEAALAVAQATLARDKAMSANAARNAARDAELLKGGLMPSSDSEKSQSDAEALAATVQADLAAVENARLQLEHCSIRSPIDGRAGNLLVDAGNVVKANDVALVTLNQVHPVEVFFSVPQRELPAIQRYRAAGRIEVRAAPPTDEARFETGELTFVDNAVDKGTGTIQLAATFPNLSDRLWPGQYVHVRLALATDANAVVAPASAIQTGRDGKYAFTIQEDSSVQLRLVTLRATVGNDAVIETGLQPGERIVTDGQLRLVPGAKVEIKADGASKGATAEKAPRKGPPAAKGQAGAKGEARERGQ